MIIKVDNKAIVNVEEHGTIEQVKHESWMYSTKE